jgi:microcystin-dependent protein
MTPATTHGFGPDEAYPPALFNYTVTPTSVPRSESPAKRGHVTLTIIVTNLTGKPQDCGQIAFVVPCGNAPSDLAFAGSPIDPDPAAGTRWSIRAEGAEGTFVATPDAPIKGLEAGESVAFFLRGVEVNDVLGTAQLRVYEDSGVTRLRSIDINKVEPGLAITSFTVDRVQVAPGESVSFEWTTTKASKATFSGAGLDESVELDGGVTRSPSISGPYTLTLEGTAADGQVSTVSAQLTLTVARVAILGFAADDPRIAQFGPTTLRWKILNASEAYINPDHIVVDAAEGSLTVKPGSTTKYGLFAKGAGPYNNASQTADVEVMPVLILKFSADPELIDLRGSSTLTWNTDWATTVRIEPKGAVAMAGQLTDSPQCDTTYTLLAQGSAGPVQQSVTVRVRPTSLLPVGTILALAGPLPADLKGQGWMHCDGGELSAHDHPCLFKAIGTAYGSKSPEVFNIPDLRGLFLRGVTGDTKRDPTASQRTASKPGGAVGNAVGSAQPYGTAPPKNPFRMSYENLDISSDTNDAGCQSRPAAYNGDTQWVDAATGGDAESRPRNKAVYFIIKYQLVTDTHDIVMPPIGSLLSFAGPAPLDAATWLPCDGRVVPRSAQPALAVAIGGAHGDDGPDGFLLPDYRGYFLRGVDGGVHRDPEAAARTPPNPKALVPARRGNSGDAVGSQQEGSTALAHVPLRTRFDYLPFNDSDKQVNGSVWRLASVNSGATKVALTAASGGDAETRPHNVSVDWYIQIAQGRSPPPLATDFIPVGTVIASGASQPPNDRYLPCDGAKLTQAAQPALFAVIGTIYGGDANKGEFNAPDYRGRFLRGAVHAAGDLGADPDWRVRIPSGTGAPQDVGSVQEDATGLPSVAFGGSVTYLPSSTVGAHGVTKGGRARVKGAKTIDTCTQGGDGDTRPVNVYVQFFIKARE